MSIRLLDQTLIDQIAAGEVVERPASVVKELVENALDAGATRIEIATSGGGKALIRVTDDGIGIAAEELALAVRRHCTSKLENGLFAIDTLGFRGEALPSIGSVAHLSLRSRRRGADGAHEIRVSGGVTEPVRPAALGDGTVVEVRELFHAVPARLKFLKSDRAEASAVTEIVRRIAIAFPHVRFELAGEDRSATILTATPGEPLVRMAAILGENFAENALALDAEREGVRLTGYAGLPAFSRGNALHQFVYVNGRPVRDRQLHAALRAGYQDAMARDRHPVAVLFLELDGRDVDVNVHPAKADVRFRDPGLVRGLLVGALRQTLAANTVRPATTGASGLMARFRGPVAQPGYANNAPGHEPVAQSFFRPLDAHPPRSQGLAEAPAAYVPPPIAPDLMDGSPAAGFALGLPRSQIDKAFIVAETIDSLVIVDQHAAHERLVYEALKAGLAARPLASQLLLIPEIVDLPEIDCERLCAAGPTLERFGLKLERFGPGAVAVRETPAMLGSVDTRALVADLADELADMGTADGLETRLHHVAATMACHGSVRSGRALRQEEMAALLRQMEATPGSGTCNHGRPTFIELKKSDLEAMFGRR